MHRATCKRDWHSRGIGSIRETKNARIRQTNPATAFLTACETAPVLWASLVGQRALPLATDKPETVLFMANIASDFLSKWTVSKRP